MTVKKALLILVIILALAMIAFCGYFGYRGWELYSHTSQMSTNERTTDAVLTDWLVNDKGFDIDAFRSTYKIEEISIESSQDGHAIPASYIYAPGNTDKSGNTVIMVHGLLGNRLSNYPMSQMFLELGYNVISYDQRSSGGNTAPNTTYGYLESNDTVDYARYAAGNMNSGSILGVWGQSLGAATVENAVDTDIFVSDVDFLILDSPMGKMSEIIGGPGFNGKVTRFFADIFYRLNLGFSFSDQNVYPQIEKCEIPVLVVASEADSSIPFEIEKSVYDAFGSDNKAFYTVTDSEHSDIYFDHPDDYSTKLVEFLKTI